MPMAPAALLLLAGLSGLTLSEARPSSLQFWSLAVPSSVRVQSPAVPRSLAVRFSNVTQISNGTQIGNGTQIQGFNNGTAAPLAAVATTFCSVSCDMLDPSQAQQETFPVGDKIQNGRLIRLHVSDADAMGWASIDSGTPGDQVWIDRSWDGGATWDGLLGQASIPSGWTGTRTLMYNLADPDNHRRGMIRACGNSGGVQCTEWAHMQACDVNACDGAPIAAGEYQPVGATTLSGRTIQLHMDNNDMAWGTISGGAASDEIWLDRSWDEGNTFPGGSSIGRVSTPNGASGTSTTTFSTRDVNARLYGGAVRACGRAVTGENGSCTSWARPLRDRAWSAANTLMWPYQPDTAWWLSSWWNSAVAVTTLMDYMKRTGDQEYLWVVNSVFNVNKGIFFAGTKSGDTVEGNFISQAIDDTLWWGVAWATAYDLTGDPKYRTEAEIIADYGHQYYDTGSCGGGIWWNRARDYKNAVTIGLYIKLNAKIHNQTPGDTMYLSRATTAWNWFVNSGMINSNSLVNDGLSGCTNNGGTVWSYNQGLAIGSGVEIYRATNDANALATARRLADAAMSNTTLTQNGILTESCDNTSSECDDNQKQFKGVFMRYIGDLADVTGVASYRNYAVTQANAIWNQDRDSLNRLGERWSGADSSANPNVRDWRTQASALSGLLAALPPR